MLVNKIRISDYCQMKNKKEHKTKIGSRENKKKIKKNPKSRGKTNGKKFDKSGRCC